MIIIRTENNDNVSAFFLQVGVIHACQATLLLAVAMWALSRWTLSSCLTSESRYDIKILMIAYHREHLTCLIDSATTSHWLSRSCISGFGTLCPPIGPSLWSWYQNTQLPAHNFNFHILVPNLSVVGTMTTNGSMKALSQYVLITVDYPMPYL